MSPASVDPVESSIRAALDMTRLLPDCYAAYRPVIKDCMVFFITHLPANRRMAILMEQAAMPKDTCVEDRFVALLRHCPTLHKLGQVVARDRRLSIAFRAQLQSLESLPPATPISKLTPLIEQELGKIRNLKIAREPMAEASVAVVVPFTWKPKRTSPPEKGVLKILKPGIKERLDEELDIWEQVGVYLEERCQSYALPLLDYRDTIERVRMLLSNEIWLDREQTNLARAGAFYEDFPRVKIPRLYPWSTPVITAMEFIDGKKVTEIKDLSADARHSLGGRIIESLLAGPFWTDSEDAWFHADPHAGNMLITPEEHVAVLDWSLVINLVKKRRETLIQMLLAGMTLDEYRLRQGLVSISRSSPDPEALKVVAAEALRKITRGVFPGFDWLVELLEQAMLRGNMTLFEDLVVFRKLLMSLIDVVADISEVVSTNDIMLNSVVHQLMGEIALRPFVTNCSRTFASHLSNTDIMGLWASWPMTVARFWMEQWKSYAQELNKKEGEETSPSG